MKKSGLKIVCEVTREDGSLAQHIVFDQRGLDYKQLLELQAKAIAPCANVVMELMSRWNEEAGKSPSTTPTA